MQSRNTHPTRQQVAPRVTITRNVTDGVPILAKNTFPTLQTLRQGLYRRRARFRDKNVSKVAVISKNVNSIPQKMLQASKCAYDGKTFLVYRGPTHLRPLKGTTKESQWFVSHVLYRQVLVHFSSRHLRDKTTPMALGSIRNCLLYTSDAADE